MRFTQLLLDAERPVSFASGTTMQAAGNVLASLPRRVRVSRLHELRDQVQRGWRRPDLVEQFVSLIKSSKVA